MMFYESGQIFVRIDAGQSFTLEMDKLAAPIEDMTSWAYCEGANTFTAVLTLNGQAVAATSTNGGGTAKLPSKIEYSGIFPSNAKRKPSGNSATMRLDNAGMPEPLIVPGLRVTNTGATPATFGLVIIGRVYGSEV